MKQKRRTLLLSLGALLLCGAVGAGFWAKAALSAPPRPVAYVNGEPITQAEFALAEGLCRADVIRYFQQAYGAAYGEGFWTDSYGGETPADRLRAQALEACARTKVMQLEARERGLIDDISYGAFAAALEEENARRAARISSGGVVYGTERYTAETYYAYVNSNLALSLKQALESDVLSYTESEVRSWYDANSGLFRRPDTIELQRIRIGYTGMDREAVRRQIEDASAALGDGVPFETVAAVYGGGVLTELIDEATARDYSKYDEAVYWTALTLDAGDTSPPFDDGGGYSILHCLRRSTTGVLDFGHAKAQAEVLFSQERFDNFLQKRYKEANIEWVG